MRRFPTLAARLAHVTAPLLLFLFLATGAAGAQATLTVGFAGSGGGTVRSVPPGINCPGDCIESYTGAGTLTLTAIPNTGSTFTGWTNGPCTGTTPCIVRVTQNVSVVANFAAAPPPPAAVPLTVTAVGAGVVTSVPPGIACSGATCTGSFSAGPVRLVATPRPDAIFMGYSGGGCGTSALCTVSLTAPTTVTATFRLPNLKVDIAGDGGGTVRGDVGAFLCSSNTRAPVRTCRQQFGQRDLVVLTASTRNIFGGWGGDCAASGTSSTCTLRMTAPRTVSVSFTLPRLTLRTQERAPVSGSTVAVTSRQVGRIPNTVACPSPCAVDAGTSVTVRATTGAGQGMLTGWELAGVPPVDVGTRPPCVAITSTCTFTMPGTNATVTASFARPTLTLATEGTGTGMVRAEASDVPGTAPLVRCAAGCMGVAPVEVDSNRGIRIRDTAAAGSVLAGVRSAPAGCAADDCTFRIATSTTVTATFARTRTLAIAVTGGGGVTGLDGPRECTAANEASCTAALVMGSQVTLTARDPLVGTSRRTWMVAPELGTCTTAPTCTIRIPETAAMPAPRLTVGITFQ